MLVLRGMTVEGEVPLLGPKTSIGTFHHGAVYYYLLAPAAMISAADPVVVTGEIALFGIAAVAGPGGWRGSSGDRWQRPRPGSWPRSRRPASTSPRSSGTRT